jgi:hypothetical protein
MTKKAIAMRKRMRKTRRRILRRERRQRGGEMPGGGYSGETVITGKKYDPDGKIGDPDDLEVTHSWA